MPAIAKGKWHWQYCSFAEPVRDRADAESLGCAAARARRAGVNERPATARLTHVRAPQLQRFAIAPHRRPPEVPARAARTGRARTEQHVRCATGLPLNSGRPAAALIRVHKRAALRVRFPEAVTVIVRMHCGSPPARRERMLGMVKLKLISRRRLQLICRSPTHAGGLCGRRPQRGKGQGLLFVDGSRHRKIVYILALFRGKPAVREAVPGPQAGNNWNRGPGTHSPCPGGSPSCSLGTGARARYVIGLINSSYLSRGPHTTYCLSSCLVTSASSASRFPGGPRGR